MDRPAELARVLKEKAKELGFAACGICSPHAIRPAAERLQAFVDAGYHGQMSWLAERMEWRGDPATLWPEARSIIMLADVYTPGEDALAVLDHKDTGAISVYARNRDYHNIVKKRLKQLAGWLVEQGADAVKVFVDTAPVMEKPLAQAAGLGWQGKHTNLLSRELGSWFFLGSVFTTAEIEHDSAEIDHCGTCRACLDVCPTKAFPAPYQLDARRCISYLTIEHKGPVDAELRPLMGNRIYGCDDCLAVCPWNKFAAQAHEIGYFARVELQRPKLAHLAGLDDASFRDVFAGSPIKRIGRDRLVRNVLYAIGNSGDQGLRPAAARLLADADATIRDAATWALGRLE